MLSVRPKITDLHFHLYARSVHPELFAACVSREIERANYRLHLNITTAGHLITFAHNGTVLTEVSASAHQPLPKQRLLISEPIERTTSKSLVCRETIQYDAQFEFEGVNPKTFLTIQQQLDERPTCEGLLHRFQSSGRMAFGAVSYINVQSFANHVKIKCFHTFPDTCAVMKCESCFRLVNPPSAT